MSTGPSDPRTIWMCTTRTCNLACHYCYQGSHVDIPQRLLKHMSEETAQRAMDWSHEWARGPLQVIYYGGEPLIRFDLIRDFVPRWRRERKERGLPSVSFSVTTNGTLLSQEIRDFMDANGVGMLLSLDGPKRLHDKSRPYHSGKKSSWDEINPEEILRWRPRLEIAWQLDPVNFDPASGQEQITVATVREMMSLGFRNIAFNTNWLSSWSEVARWNLQWLFKDLTLMMVERQAAVDRGDPKAHEIGLGCNWFGKLRRALETDSKMAQPCGTGMNMVGISAEGWLYPSQEMVYTVEQPGKAPGTSEYYRIGNLYKSPVLDVTRLAEVSQIRTAQMKPSEGFACKSCVAHSACIGGCHCRYVGSDGMDPSNRFDIPAGYCQSTIAVHSGMLMGASVSRWIRPAKWNGQPYTKSMNTRSGQEKGTSPVKECAPTAPSPAITGPRQPPVTTDQLKRIAEAIEGMSKRLDGIPLVRIEEV